MTLTPELTHLPLWALLLIALAAGGVISQLISRFWLSRKEESDAAHQLREEMRAALKEMDGRVDKLQSEVNDWREKYFRLLEEHTMLRIENRTLRAELDLINPKPALYTRELPQSQPVVS